MRGSWESVDKTEEMTACLDSYSGSLQADNLATLAAKAAFILTWDSKTSVQFKPLAAASNYLWIQVFWMRLDQPRSWSDFHVIPIDPKSQQTKQALLIGSLTSLTQKK